MRILRIPLIEPNNMSLTLSYEAQRDLLTGMVYKRSNTTVATRSYAYDTLGRPSTSSTAKDGVTHNDVFHYTKRSELVNANLNGVQHGYDYDNIGNRRQAIEGSNYSQYTANNLNQYTDIYGSVNGQEFDFTPTFDDAGNQTLVKTSTGIWSVVYDAENRPISFTNAESSTVVECTYDYMGRRATKKVTVNGAVTLHHRYLYRGYLQIACCDLTRAAHPCLWLITWDPSQATATRPLVIQKDATWYTYGRDLTKNICEVYGQHGYIRTNYTYSPFGQVTATGDVTQPIQWSSEYHDTELALVYYNYRHYNPTDGRWLGRDKILKFHKYNYVLNRPISLYDYIGLNEINCVGFCNNQSSNFTPGTKSLKEAIEEHGWTCTATSLNSKDCDGDLNLYDIMALYIYIKGKHEYTLTSGSEIKTIPLKNLDEAKKIIKEQGINCMYSQKGIWDLSKKYSEHNDYIIQLSPQLTELSLAKTYGENTTKLEKSLEIEREKFYSQYSLQAKLDYDFHGVLKHCTSDGKTVWKYVAHYYAAKFKTAEAYYEALKNDEYENAAIKKNYFDVSVGVPVIEIANLTSLNIPLTYEKYCCTRKK